MSEALVQAQMEKDLMAMIARMRAPRPKKLDARGAQAAALVLFRDVDAGLYAGHDVAAVASEIAKHEMLTSTEIGAAFAGAAWLGQVLAVHEVVERAADEALRTMEAEWVRCAQIRAKRQVGSVLHLKIDGVICEAVVEGIDPVHGYYLVGLAAGVPGHPEIKQVALMFEHVDDLSPAARLMEVQRAADQLLNSIGPATC